LWSGDKQFAYFQTATTPGQGDWHFGSAVASADMLDDAHVVMKFLDNLPFQLVPAWQLSGLQTRPVKDFLPYSRNEWKYYRGYGFPLLRLYNHSDILIFYSFFIEI
jgi:hypothetical protein